jgi:mRNA-degrading endonuclease RelE of RelBE toxin-antitoxin system/PHD/YefM family antitoxin component YafN of YafNO toxin-antitoxin module
MYTITSARARQTFRDVINRSSHNKERVILTRGGKEICGLVPLADLQVLEELETDLDLEAIKKALADPVNTESVPWNGNGAIEGYQIRILPTAKKELFLLPEAVQKSISKEFDRLAGNPRPRGVKSDFYKLPLGNDHILYQVQDDHSVILVVKVGRREIYRENEI